MRATGPISVQPSERVVLTPTEFASIFGRHYTWAYRQIYAGKIKIISKLGRMMIPRSEVDRLLQEKDIYTGKDKARSGKPNLGKSPQPKA